MGTLTANNITYASAGSQKKVVCDLAFGSSYNNTGVLTTTGETINAYQLGMAAFSRVVILPAYGYEFQALMSLSGAEVQYPAAARVRVLDSAGTPAGDIITTENEVVTVVANVGTLAALPALVQSVDVTAGGVTGPFLIISGLLAPASGQVAIDLATGTLTFNAADAVTSATVSYIEPAILFAAGVGTEVPNGTNLSSTLAVVHAEFYGY